MVPPGARNGSGAAPGKWVRRTSRGRPSTATSATALRDGAGEQIGPRRLATKAHSSPAIRETANENPHAVALVGVARIVEGPLHLSRADHAFRAAGRVGVPAVPAVPAPGR